MELVEFLQQSLGLVELRAPLRGEGAQPVPLVADALAARVDGGRVVVVERVELLRDGGDLFDALLVGGQVRLEGLVLLLQRLWQTESRDWM